jgi:Asp-tRNA(Asn)/Glu-tRNA(Gln) amidotransferase A subunit family amidase
MRTLAKPARFAFGVPGPYQGEFFDDHDAALLFESAITRMEALGGSAVSVDLEPFLQAASLLYRGAWLAERTAAIDAAIGRQRNWLHPVTRQIIAGGDAISGGDVFRDRHSLADLRRRTEPVWQRIDCLLLPTAATIYRIADVEADPLALNERLGCYTNFTNLLDLAAIAVPNGFLPNGLHPSARPESHHRPPRRRGVGPPFLMCRSLWSARISPGSH